MEIARDRVRIVEWLGSDLMTTLSGEVKVIWLSPVDTGGDSVIVAVHLMTSSGAVRLV